MNTVFTEKRMAHGAWRMAHGAWRMAHGAWRMAHIPFILSTF
jgi:hypothetical protein